jgi:hypothetical protein
MTVSSTDCFNSVPGGYDGLAVALLSEAPLSIVWRALASEPAGVKNGSSHGRPQALCRACGQSVTVRDGTAYWDVNAEPAMFEMAIRALAEGNSLRSTARIVHIDQATACDWLDRAAQHCRQVLPYLWRDLPVSECQLDELWSFVHTKESHLAMAKRGCETSGEAWMWTAFAPVWRRVLAFVVGKRTQESANLWLKPSLTSRLRGFRCSRATSCPSTAVSTNQGHPSRQLRDTTQIFNRLQRTMFPWAETPRQASMGQRIHTTPLTTPPP